MTGFGIVADAIGLVVVVVLLVSVVYLALREGDEELEP